MIKKHVLLIAVEKKEFYNQALFLIISVLALCSKTSIHIHIYSDSYEWLPNYLSDYVKFNLISKEDLKNFKGEQDFIHRIKIVIIKKLSTEVEGKVLYIDTDCYCIKDLGFLFERIKPNMFVMHKREYFLDLDINSYLQNPHIINSLIHFSHQPNNANKYYMWNAGVIGGDALDLLSLCDEVLKTTDIITKKVAMHTAEQFAFSLCLQRNGIINPANKVIYHYWDKYEKQCIQEYIRTNIDILINLHQKNKFVTLKNIFILMKYNIRCSYIYNRGYAIERLERNNFISGYWYMLKAFIPKLHLDNDFQTKLAFHSKRHMKHVVKQVIKW